MESAEKEWGPRRRSSATVVDCATLQEGPAGPSIQTELDDGQRLRKDYVVIKELLGRAPIGITATVYAHVRLRLQRQVIDTLGNAFAAQHDDPDAPPAAAVVR
ncbi:hypothetical protein ACF1B0_32865 [Streptomyces anandii]|uniref:hypothetical protein n=1 Tax=Streptomyces anandii TaxID=285454 RepID=UPI0036F54809